MSPFSNQPRQHATDVELVLSTLEAERQVLEVDEDGERASLGTTLLAYIGLTQAVKTWLHRRAWI